MSLRFVVRLTQSWVRAIPTA